MRYLVERLAEVQGDGVNLLSSVKSFCQVMYGRNQLGLTGSVFPKAVLLVGEDTVRVQMVYDLAVDDCAQGLCSSLMSGSQAGSCMLELCPPF